MEMWLKQSTLVLLTVAVAAMGISDQAPVILDENYKSVAVPYGSSLTFNCSLRTESYERFRVSWYFNPSEPSYDKSHNLSNVTVNKSAKNSTKLIIQTNSDWKDDLLHTEETLFIYTVTNKNNGWYFCEVNADIPILETVKSNGSQVVITKSMEPTTYPSIPIVTGEQATVSPPVYFSLNKWMWILLGVSTFSLIVLLIICVLLRRRRRRSRAADPIYANTRPVAIKQPSPRPGVSVENLKTVSSSQNLRNLNPGRRYDEGKLRHK